MTGVSRAALSIDVRPVTPAGARQCTVEVFAPASLDPASANVVAFCLPGGGFSRRYFDLEVPPDVGEYSMARFLAASGLIVVTCDPLGIGDSDVPDDPSELTPGALATTQVHVTSEVLARLRGGTACDALPPLSDVRPVGVGHSAGALLTVYQQARHHQFDAVALLGFAGRGLADFLTDDERAYIGDPTAFRVALPRLVEQRFGSALPHWEGGNSTLFAGQSAPEPVKDAMRAAQSPMLGLLGLTSMMPGASAAELEAIDVPVFLGVGSNDITGPPHRIPSDFPNARDVTLFVLEGAGHTHNIHTDRARLWTRLVRWTRELT
jgi:pimeloyl-ACP methyl ester carboxylesterase